MGLRHAEAVDAKGEGCLTIFRGLRKGSQELPCWTLNAADENSLDLEAVYSTPCGWSHRVDFSIEEDTQSILVVVCSRSTFPVSSYELA